MEPGLDSGLGTRDSGLGTREERKALRVRKERKMRKEFFCVIGVLCGLHCLAVLGRWGA